MSKVMKHKKLIALIACVAIAISAAAYGIVGTLAAPANDKDYVQFTQSAASAAMTQLDLAGGPVEYQVGGANVTGWKSTNDVIATAVAKTGDSTRSIVTPKAAGIVTVIAGDDEGFTYAKGYQVFDKTNIVKYKFADGKNAKLDKSATLDIKTKIEALDQNGASCVSKIKWYSLSPDYATVDETTGVITASSTNDGFAVIVGKAIDVWGVEQSIPFTVAVGKAGQSGKEVITNTDGSHWTKVQEPDIYGRSDEDGNLLAPPEYRRDNDGNPANGINGDKMVPGADGNWYKDNADNTYQKWDPENRMYDQQICGGKDQIPGNTDDRADITVTGGVKYLGPNEDGSYQRKGADQKLGTDDDVKVWKVNPALPIGPTNETETNPNPALPDGITDKSGTRGEVGWVFSADGYDWRVIHKDASGNLLILCEQIIKTGAAGTWWYVGDLFADIIISPSETYWSGYKASEARGTAAYVPSLIPYMQKHDAFESQDTSDFIDSPADVTSDLSAVSASGYKEFFMLSVSEYNAYTNAAIRSSVGKNQWTRSSREYVAGQYYALCPCVVQVNGAIKLLNADDTTGGYRAGNRPATWIHF